MLFSLLIFPLIFAWAYNKFDVRHEEEEEA
jgi:hypothetical protein